MSTLQSQTPGNDHTAAPDRQGDQRRLRVTLADAPERYALVAATVVIAVIFSVLPATASTFPTLANVQAVLANQAVVALVALAALIPLVCNQFDLSVGATAGLTSIFAASALGSGAPLIAAIALALGLGAVVGCVNGAVVTRALVNAVIATLGMATVLHGVVTWRAGGESIVQGIPPELIAFGSGATLGIPRPVLFVAFMTVIVWYVLDHTPYGRHLYAMGSNRDAAHLIGLNTRFLLFSTFVVAGLLAATAGVLQIARSGGASPQVGENFTLPALAAAFLSAASIKPGKFNVWGTIVAIVFLATLNSGLNLAGAENYVNDLVNGIALIAGVALAGLLGRRRAVGAGPRVS